jgi:hypothetical protein
MLVYWMNYDSRALCGAILSACQGALDRRILMKIRNKEDVIRTWY